MWERKQASGKLQGFSVWWAEGGGGAQPVSGRQGKGLSNRTCQGSTLIEAAHPWPGTLVTMRMSCFMAGDPDKEYGANKPPPAEEFGKGLKEHCVSSPLPRILSLSVPLG